MQTFGLRTHAWNTALRSILLLARFPLLLAAMGYALALLLVAGEAPSVQAGLSRAAGLLPAIIPAAILLACLWFTHARILEFVTGARRVTDPRREPRHWRLTETLCISRGMPLPRLSVIETPARNAYAAGLTRRKASVAVTRGLIEALDNRELSAVIAHELSHIRNGDARLGVIAAVFVGVITLVTGPVWRMLRLMRWQSGTGRSRRSSSGGRKGRGGGSGATLVLIAIGVVIAALVHLLAIVLRMALSRNREYLADAGAVEMTQDADAMISALRKVAQLPEARSGPGAGAVPARRSAVARRRMVPTHPPIDERVALLVRFAGGRDPGPLPAIEAAPEPEHAAELTDAARKTRSPILERLDAMAHFARTKNPAVMQNQALREQARRTGQGPDTAAPPPPRCV